MSEHVLIKTDPLAAIIAERITKHLDLRGVVFAKCFGTEVWIGEAATQDLALELGEAVARSLKYAGQTIELAPGDRIAKMSDIREAVRLLVNEAVDQREAARKETT